VNITKDEGEKRQWGQVLAREAVGGGGTKEKEKGDGESSTREEGGGVKEGRRRACENKNELPVMSKTPRPSPQSNDIWRQKLPAIQAEQVEDDVAPVKAEYVPARASEEEYASNPPRLQVYNGDNKKRHEKKVWKKQGRVIKAACRWHHLQGMK
jgi:hypothetical protein